MKTLAGPTVRTSGSMLATSGRLRLRRWLGVSLLLICVAILSEIPDRAVATDLNGGLPPGETAEDGNSGIDYSAELGSDDAFARSRDSCVTVSWSQGPPKHEYEQIKKIAKDGSVTFVNGKILRTERLVKLVCKDGRTKEFWKCTSCPPSVPPPDFKRMVRSHLRGRTQTTELQQPTKSLWPNPSKQVPLPGVAFFYGISKSQFETVQPDWLTVCAGFDCVSFSLRSKPIRVWFTPGDGTPRKTSCNWAGPAVMSKKDAFLANDPVRGEPLRRCRHIYQKAGKFSANVEILYEVTWDFLDWTLVGPRPVVETGVLYVTTGLPFDLTVHQRQPVVMG